MGKPKVVEPIPFDLTKQPADTVWDDYFSKNKPAPRAVADLALKLIDAKRHDHAAAMLEAAILHGQSQAWMYEALAVSMQATDRPKDEIERVLLSVIDVAATVPHMIYTAAYLTRYGRVTRALELYRQASQMDPTRPEPYALGLKLAQETHDTAAIDWAVSGTLSHVWTKDYADYHKTAEAAAIDLAAQLRSAQKVSEAEELERHVAEARVRDLVLEFSWSGNADVDMLVEEPGGSVCAFNRPRTSGGGVFVHDGFGPGQKDTYEKYILPRGMTGEYLVRLKLIQGDPVGKRGALTIISHQGTKDEKKEVQFISLGAQDKIVRIRLDGGRLKEPLPVPDLEEPLVGRRQPPARPDIWALAQGNQAKVLGRVSRQLAGGGGGGFFGPAGIAFQPIIVNVPEGVSLTASAVVSVDRRYVRIGVSPLFTAITDVQTFSFFSQFLGGQGQGQQGP